jgi:GNAT superfamily N-acetyltransferase
MDTGRATLITGGAELLARVAPLWGELRRHHAALSPQWREQLLGSAWDARRAGLIAKAAGGLLVLLAERDGVDVGYCIATITLEGRGEIDSLFVADSHRRHGIGRALMSRAMAWLGERGASPVVVELIAGNDDALRFYESFGFKPRTLTCVHAIEPRAVQDGDPLTRKL